MVSRKAGTKRIKKSSFDRRLRERWAAKEANRQKKYIEDIGATSEDIQAQERANTIIYGFLTEITKEEAGKDG